jgi:hypothetical protein
MIGLMFFGAIGLWGIIAIALSLWAAKLAGAKWRWLAALVLMPLVFFAPVADEIVAYPQIKKLCAEGSVLELKNGYTEQSLNNLVFNAAYDVEKITIFPSSVKLQKYTWSYHDVEGNKIFGVSYNYNVSNTFLNISDGSSGGKMAVLINRCGNESTQKIAEQIKKLNLVREK